MLNELAPILTTKDVKAITGVAETSTLNKMVANKQFPKPLKRKSSRDPFRWKKSDVQPNDQPNKHPNLGLTQPNCCYCKLAWID